MYVCLCFAITDKQIKDLIKDGKTYEEIIDTTNVTTGCGACRFKIKHMTEGKMVDLFNMFDNLNGLTVEKAKALIPSVFDVRVVEEGEAITLEYRDKRINLFTKDGIVKSVSRG